MPVNGNEAELSYLDNVNFSEVGKTIATGRNLIGNLLFPKLAKDQVLVDALRKISKRLVYL